MFVELRGNPRQMGQQFGEAFRDEIKEFAEARLRECIEHAARGGAAVSKRDVLDFCGRILSYHERYDETVWEEFCGICEGANIEPEMLMICNGLTDIQDAVLVEAAGKSEGCSGGQCTAWMAAPEATEAGEALGGQTWDMYRSAEKFIVVVKRVPNEGPATLSMTTVGCLSLIGLNSEGVAVGNNNLQPTDAGEGVVYLAMIHRALSQRTLAGAVNSVTLAVRCSGHNYWFVGPEGEIVDVETTARQFEVIQPAGSVYAHTNHYLTPRLQRIERPAAVGESTMWRLNRMLRILHEQSGEITPRSMMRMMSDTSGAGDCRICRVDPEDRFPTCGAAVISPQTRRMWIAKGRPREDGFVEYSL